MSRAKLCERLRMLDKYLILNPRTGALSFDVERAASSAELRCLLAEIWDEGYESGFVDADDNPLVSECAQNPFR